MAEAIEDEGQEIRLDAMRIFHADFHVRVHTRHKVDESTRWRELHAL